MSETIMDPPSLVPEDLLACWMLPFRIYLNLMEQGLAFMTDAGPPVVGKAAVMREAEDQLAALDEAAATIPTTAALVA